MHIKKQTWGNGIQYEVDFWSNWLITKGSIWQEAYNYRIDPDSELEPYLAVYVNHITGTPKILDVGAGPMTCLGKKINGRKIDLVATDALADYYAKLPFPDGLPLLKTIQCDSECLSEKYGAVFDLTHARNTVDHSYDPFKVFLEMIKVTKRAGFIVTDHAANEAIKENWNGFHQWNFSVENRELIVSNKKSSWSINKEVQGKAKIIDLSPDSSEWVRFVLQKY